MWIHRGRRARRLHRRGAAAGARGARWTKRGYLDGSDMADHLQHAARQRPDLVVRGQQLPAGQGPVPVRPAYWNADATRMPARCTASICATCTSRTGWPSPAASRWRRADRLGKIRAGLFPLDAGGPHRAVEVTYAAPGCSGARCGSCSAVGPHRRRRQPARGRQIQPLAQSRPAGLDAEVVRGRDGNSPARGGRTGSAGSPPWTSAR